MNILYFSAFYKPEAMAASFRATEQSKIWTELGNNVTVFTGYPNYPKGYIFGGYTPRLLMKEKLDGVDVIRSKVIAKKNTSILKRLQNALSYYFFGRINICFNKKKIGKDYDVVLGTSGVVFNALLAYRYARKIKAPFVLEIRDITFEQMIAVGKKPGSMSVRMMKYLELKLCQKAKSIVVVSHGYKKILIDNGIAEEKIAVITNGVDIEECSRQPEDGLLLSYFGTIGISQDIEEAFDYADVIREYVKDFEFLVVGDGALQESIVKRASQTDYVKVLKGMPIEQLEPLYDRSLLSLVKLKKTDNFKYTIPSKIFQIMGRGIAVLFVGPDGETAGIIRDNKAGIVLTGDKESDIRQIRSFFSQNDWRNKLEEMGRNGAETVKQQYSRYTLSKEYLTILDRAKKKR